MNKVKMAGYRTRPGAAKVPEVCCDASFASAPQLTAPRRPRAQFLINGKRLTAEEIAEEAERAVREAEDAAAAAEAAAREAEHLEQEAIHQEQAAGGRH